MPETLNPLTPTLTNAVAKILQLAAQAAMQGKSDRDILSALDAIGGEIRAAEMEYHGNAIALGCGEYDTNATEEEIPW